MDMQNVCPTCAAFKFKLAAGTGSTKHYACSVTCDPCKPAKFEGTIGYYHIWILDI